MNRWIKNREQKTGQAPGTLVHIGERKQDTPRVMVMDFDRNGVREGEITNVEQCLAYNDTPGTTWVQVEGLHDVALLSQMGECFNIHPLVLEDILNTDQRPKLEEYEDQLFVVLKKLDFREVGQGYEVEQLSFLLGQSHLISFQEATRPIFRPVEERILQGKGKIRQHGNDYLLYTLMDGVIDHYFQVLEQMGDELDKLEGEIIRKPQRNTVKTLHQFRRRVTLLRKHIWPLRDVVRTLSHTETTLIGAETRIFFRDLYDHVLQVSEMLDTYRDILASIAELHQSLVSNRTNETMKLLTLFSTIFLPLTFIVGVYGMNFEHMPELSIWWAYPAVWGVMILVAGGMLGYFRWKKLF